MKRIIALFASLFVLLAQLAPVAIVLAPAVTLSACKTSQTTVAYKSLGSLTAAVSTALTAWADFVIDQRIQIGKIADRSEQSAALLALTNKELKVQSALSAYKAAATLAQVGVNEALSAGKSAEPAPAAMLAAGQTLISTATSLSK